MSTAGYRWSPESDRSSVKQLNLHAGGLKPCARLGVAEPRPAGRIRLKSQPIAYRLCKRFKRASLHIDKENPGCLKRRRFSFPA